LKQNKAVEQKHQHIIHH